MANLAGKFIIHDEDETYRTGEIVSEINDEYVLVRQDFMKEPEGPSYMMQVVSIKSMADSYHDDRPEWQIFNSKKELEEYIGWFEKDHSALNEDMEEEEEDELERLNRLTGKKFVYLDDYNAGRFDKKHKQ
jgi:hypothetical protein